MITSFFKPKTKKPLKSSPSSTSDSSSDSAGKRSRDNDCAAEKDVDHAVLASPKRLKGSKTSPSVKSQSVQHLVSYLDTHDGALTWKTQLASHFQLSSFAKLADFVAAERRSHTIYPAPCNTFAALNLCALDKVKVVIVGQDPYHGPNQAHGLCFSVERGQPVPPSLKNIYKELREDPAINFQQPNHGCLLRWAKQGVLMLNSVLTVRKGEANSHAKKGWEAVTDEIIRAVDRCSKEQGKGVVFLLWGKPATAKAQGVLQTSNRHTIICTSHPSPLGASKTKTPFLGSRCFSRCNAILEKAGSDPIDWNVD
jgi:uracil-DNA glycosylase